MPAAFSSPSLASTCAASARRPSVSTAGACCSARSAGAARPRRAASQSARCSARPRAYGTNPSEYTRQRPAGDIAPPHGGNAPQDRREGAPRRADAPRRAAQPMRAVEEAPSTGQVLRLAWAWASVCVRVWWWWGRGEHQRPLWHARTRTHAPRNTQCNVFSYTTTTMRDATSRDCSERAPGRLFFFFFFLKSGGGGDFFFFWKSGRAVSFFFFHLRFRFRHRTAVRALVWVVPPICGSNFRFDRGSMHCDGEIWREVQVCVRGEPRRRNLIHPTACCSACGGRQRGAGGGAARHSGRGRGRGAGAGSDGMARAAMCGCGGARTAAAARGGTRGRAPRAQRRAAPRAAGVSVADASADAVDRVAQSVCHLGPLPAQPWSARRGTGTVIGEDGLIATAAHVACFRGCVTPSAPRAR